MELKNQIETILSELEDCAIAVKVYDIIVESEITTELEKQNALNKMIEIVAEFDELQQVLKNRLEAYIEFETKDGNVVDFDYRRMLTELKKRT